VRWLIGLGVTIIGLIIFLTMYLQPNSFLGCSETPLASSECDKADAIVVISGGDTAARTEAGIALYENGWADVLVFSGAAQDKSGPSNAAVMKTIAQEHGVPTSAIIIDEEAETTRQNAEKSTSLFTQNGFEDVILVTSGYHQRRASLEFAQRAETIEIRNYPLTQDNDWGWWWWMTPRGWWLAGGEAAKIIAFYLGASS